MIAGTENAIGLYWGPDSEELGYDMLWQGEAAPAQAPGRKSFVQDP